MGRLNRAEYQWWVERDVVIVVDLDQGRSVTNDAPGVIQDLAGKGVLSRRRVFYRDTSGEWGELVVAGGRFARFAPLSPEEGERASRSAAGRLN